MVDGAGTPATIGGSGSADPMTAAIEKAQAEGNYALAERLLDLRQRQIDSNSRAIDNILDDD